MKVNEKLSVFFYIEHQQGFATSDLIKQVI
jgi:hypothetical protein